MAQGPQVPIETSPERPSGPRPPTPLAPEKTRWRPSNLTLRFLTALLLVPPVIWVCYAGGLAYVGVVVAFSAIAINEFYSFIEAKGAVPQRLLGTLAAIALPVLVYLTGSAYWVTSFMTALLLTVMILQLTKAEIHEAIANVSATFFGVFYVGWLLSHAVSVRFFDEHLKHLSMYAPPDVGFFYMLLCLTAAVLCDAGAYFVGRRYGRRRLAPNISPNKTVEGAIGGILVSMAAAAVVKFIFDHWIQDGALSRDFTYLAAALFGLVLAAMAILGDLVESVLKRDAELKDAGRILPGVGGVLDRIDSALMTIPVMYYMLLAYYYVRFKA